MSSDPDATSLMWEMASKYEKMIYIYTYIHHFLHYTMKEH